MDLDSLSNEQIKEKLKKCLRALEFYASAEKLLVTHKPRAQGPITVKLTKQDNGEVARQALSFDPSKEFVGNNETQA